MVSLELQKLIFKYSDKEISVIEKNGKCKIAVYEPQKTLFGFIILKHKKPIFVSTLKYEEITWVEEYQKFASKCFNENPTGKKTLDILHAAIGMAAESSEVLDILKKNCFHSKPYDKQDICDEIGDLTFYLFAMMNLLKINLRNVFIANMIKIESRYPNGREKGIFQKKDKKREKELQKEYLDSVEGEQEHMDLSLENKN